MVAEFGDELDTSKIRRVATQRAEESEEAEAAGKGPGTQSAVAPTARPETVSIDEIVELKVQIKTLEKGSEALAEKLAAAQQDAENARRMVKRLEDAIAAENAPNKLENLIKEIAFEAAEQDKEFAKLLERVEMTDMPIAMSRALENICRAVLRIQDERVPLADLLAEL